MAEESHSYNLLDALMKRSQLSWYWATAVVAAVLILFLILAAYLDGIFSELSAWLFWRDYLDSPVLIIYTLVVYPFMWRLWKRTIQVFQPLLSPEVGALNQLVPKAPTPKRRWQWAAVFIGAIFFLSLSQPWGWNWISGEIWLNVYEVVTFPLLFGLLGWLFYNGLASSRYLARLSHKNLKLDIFEPGLLTPVARWSLGTSFAFISGISMSLAFQIQENLLVWQNITIYAVLIGVTVLLFFLSMWSTHSAMAKAKSRELAPWHENI